MAGNGPAPKDTHSRQRDTKRRQAGAVTVTPDNQLRGPAFPKSIPNPHPETISWWEKWRRSPQAQLFESTDWESLKRAALLHNSIWNSPGKPPTTAMSELRIIEERFGATYVDRQRARINIVRPADPAQEQQSAAKQTKADLRARLQGGSTTA